MGICMYTNWKDYPQFLLKFFVRHDEIQTWPTEWYIFKCLKHYFSGCLTIVDNQSGTCQEVAHCSLPVPDSWTEDRLHWRKRVGILPVQSKRAPWYCSPDLQHWALIPHEPTSCWTISNSANCHSVPLCSQWDWCVQGILVVVIFEISKLDDLSSIPAEKNSC